MVRVFLLAVGVSVTACGESNSPTANAMEAVEQSADAEDSMVSGGTRDDALASEATTDNGTVKDNSSDDTQDDLGSDGQPSGDPEAEDAVTGHPSEGSESTQEEELDSATAETQDPDDTTEPADDTSGNNGEDESLAGETTEGPAADPEDPTTTADAGTTGETTPPAEPEPTVEAVSFEAVFEDVFEPEGCATGYCHGGMAGELSFADADSTYDTLLNSAPSKESCGLTSWVVPGEPEQSILWYRVRPLELEEGEPCVDKMPDGSDGLDAESAQQIYDWILSGATR